ncbi:MAG: phosphomannomutase/phosphoglucomutase, partial [Bacteroidia bacterium]|nr:phosphomannomutase/phosphoglucomutase [Bacteroidia bacterium]
MNWKKLQNGSDLRGVALEGIVGENVNLTPEVAQILGKSFVQWLQMNTPSTTISVAVGMDSRISGKDLKKAFMKGLLLAGANVFDCGLASTPAMFMTTVLGNKSITAGVMITASHLPFNRNGFKFFTNKGGLDKKDISQLLSFAEENDFNGIEGGHSVESWDFIDVYASFLVDYIRNKANIISNFDKPLQ